MNFQNIEIRSDGCTTKVFVDEKELRKITEISIDIMPLEFPKVRIEMEGALEIKGKIVTGGIEKVKCPECGHFVGEIIGEFSVSCPECGTKIISRGSFGPDQ